MPVTRPLLSCSPFLSFQSALRASGQSCAQCSWFLDNLHSVQPEKVMFIRRTQSTFVRCSCCPTTASCISLSPSVTRACSCLFIQRLALRLSWTENIRGRGEFQCIQLGYWVDGCFIFWRCRPHRIFMWETQTYQSVLVVQTHTNRLSHFSFFLPANFLHFLSFSFLSTSLSQPSTSFSQQSTVCSHF